MHFGYVGAVAKSNLIKVDTATPISLGLSSAPSNPTPPLGSG